MTTTTTSTTPSTTASTSAGETKVAAVDELSLNSQIAAATAELDEFRTAVRDEIIRIHQASIWCLDGTNGALEDLDLSPLSFDYTGTVTISVDVTVQNADSEDTALAWVRGALRVDSDDDDVTIEDTHISTYDGLSRSRPA